MKSKKIFSSILALALGLGLAACSKNEPKTEGSVDEGSAANTAVAETSTDAEKTDEEDLKNFKTQTSDDTLVIGVPSLSGDFVAGYTNSSYDVCVRELIGIGRTGYATYASNEDGEFVWNPTILKEEPEIKENEDGSKTVTYKLKEDLKWSDGENVTADDYMFAMLLLSNSEYTQLTGSTEIGYDSLKGYNDYHEGNADTLEGVKKIDDYSFEITIDSEYLPYYEEQYLFSVEPRPIHLEGENLAIDPENGNKLVAKEGYELTEEDKKNYIDQVDAQIKSLNQAFEDSAAEEEPSEEDKKAHEESIKELEDKKKEAESGQIADVSGLLVEDAILYDANTYRLTPTVTTGPYKFIEFANNMVKMELNENFAGNFKGEKPSVPKVIVQAINSEIAIDLVENGDIDIWENETTGSKIDQMRKAADEGKIGGYITYDRNGYGNLQFLTDRGATQYKEVRQAIAYLMDRNDFVQNFAGGYAVVTNGMYGTSQWMYKDKGADLEAELNNYTLNIDQANEILDQSPYKFEKDGKTPWDKEKGQEAYQSNAAGFDYWRYDENGKKLQVNQFGSDSSEITTLLNNQLPDNAKQAGMEYNVQEGDFATLLNYLYYPEDDPVYSAFNMGTSFEIPFDPYYEYNSNGNDNIGKVNDPKADELTVKLRQTKPGDKEAYLETWMEFEKWFNDYLPEIPLYSNQYHTAYTKRVEGFDVATPYWGISRQINEIKLK
jgi:peptide/nickel transport system substrate-binding protein